MVSKIPINFLKSAEPAIATYDYVDIASGTGYKIFYGGWCVDSTVLTPYAFYSYDVLHVGGNAGGTFATVFDHDYDVEFRLPMTVKGRLIANVPLGMERNTANTLHIRATVYVRKWDGTTETEIASNVGSDWQSSVTNKRVMDAIDVDIPETTFKAGESLRITVLIEMHTINNGSGDYGFYGHDPQGRSQDENDTVDFSTYPSVLSFQVPFKIEL